MSAVTQIGQATVSRNEALEAEVGQMWLNTIRHIEDVLEGSKFGFQHFAEWADPSIEQIVASITKIDGLLNSILDGAMGVVSHSCEVQLANCQQSIHLIRRVHIALKYNNQSEYDDVITKLTQQSK
ncbi:hypothetical protein ST27_10165 [Xanthomonas phaseoli pv. phaseoli]|uniref:hypothetical protein n=1 Tax=Xanthomonas phaseoli TaxID=1985254 RepID=UPI000595FF16|nr:hypothetical protein [Xanthomonas phaseoli]KIJ00456.1 hypothetical protein ST27_10165 [Xanthomonas phaseoli pv. phaseoli]UZB30952.1 hypothetical protein OM951_11015 [Xanthomonas phaseoli pv. phaseoli]